MLPAAGLRLALHWANRTGATSGNRYSAVDRIGMAGNHPRFVRRQEPFRFEASEFSAVSLAVLTRFSIINRDRKRRTAPPAWLGWPDNPREEQLRERWIDNSDEAEQQRLAAEIQRIALTDALYVPLGHYVLKSAWRSNVTGVLRASAPVMWNVAKG
jgi:ABC-type transport system substrate-binding protein